MPAVDCGIDIGSTNIKVVLLSDEGEILWTRAQPSPRVHDAHGPVTDPIALVLTLESMIIEGWRALGLGQPLRSITATGIGEDGCCVDGDLKPLSYAIPWFDKRAAQEARSLGADNAFLARTGMAVDETSTASKWLWLHNNQPDAVPADATWIALTDFPAAFWSGTAFMSNGLAPRTACFDVQRRIWIPELLAAAHAPTLPGIHNAGAVVGSVEKGALRETGAASTQTALVAGGHDHPVAASLIRRMDKNARVDSMGTANLIYGETARFDDPRLLDQLAFSVPPSGDGFACLGVIEFSTALAELADKDQVRSAMAQPGLPGEPPSSVTALHTKAADPAMQSRRALEKLCLKARGLFNALDTAGVPQGSIYATGGWSRSQAFMALRASILAKPIIALGELEMTALGAALFGSEATSGIFALPAALQNVITIEPVANWVKAYASIEEAEVSW